jgi:hypothetical protein
MRSKMQRAASLWRCEDVVRDSVNRVERPRGARGRSWCVWLGDEESVGRVGVATMIGEQECARETTASATAGDGEY